MADERENEQDEPETEQEGTPELADTGSRDVLSDFFAQYAGGGFRFAIHRREPKQYTFNGQMYKVGGHLDTVSEPPSPDYLFQMWGGGVYDIRVLGPSKSGTGVRYITSRTVDVAGEPKPRLPLTTGTSHEPTFGGAAPLVDRMLDDAKEEKRRAQDELALERRQRLEAERHRSEAERRQLAASADPALWETTVGAIKESVQTQVATLREQLARREAELLDLRREVHSRPAGDLEFVKLLERRSQDDISRLSETHRRELEAERREHEQTVAMIERLHRSEVDNLKSSTELLLANSRAASEQAIAAAHAAHEQAVANKDREIARLEEELRAAREASRPEDALSEMQRIQTLLEAARGLVPMTGAEEPPSMAEKILDRVEPLAARVLDHLAQSREAQIARMMRVRPALRRPVPPLRPEPAATTAEPETPAQNPVAPPAQSPVATPAQNPAIPTGAALAGLDFLESSIRGGRPGAEAAHSAISLFPKALLEQLAATSIDEILAEVENHAHPDSAILSPAGRPFLIDFCEALRAEMGS